jgi:hypothetical protein
MHGNLGCHSETSLYFWRTSNGAEVDLVLEKHGQIQTAVEIKSLPLIESAHCTGLRAFHQEYPAVPLFAVCTTEHPYRVGDVRVVSYGDYLERLKSEKWN